MLLKSYQEFPNLPWFEKEKCENITTPCWIPHAAKIIESISTNMEICDTLDKYTCMLSTMKAAKTVIQEQCSKSCKSGPGREPPRPEVASHGGGTVDAAPGLCWSPGPVLGRPAAMPFTIWGCPLWVVGCPCLW